MLEHLYIKNYVLITSLDVDFTSSFTALSGETGAGKSIIMGALSLALGEKCKQDVVRSGESEAVISAIFSYKDTNISLIEFLIKNELKNDDNTIFISRTIKATGRNIIRVNSQLVSREILQELGALLVDITSQKANLSLLKDDKQRDILDRFSKSEAELNRYKELYKKYQQLEKEKRELIEKSNKAKQDYDYYSYCVNELESANLVVNEDDELSSELKKLSLKEVLSEEVSYAHSLLKGDVSSGALALIEKAVGSLNKASDKDESIRDYKNRLESCLIEAEDISFSLRDYLSSLTIDSATIDMMSERLALLQRIKKKYGPTISDALDKLNSYKEYLDSADNFEFLLSKKEKEVNACLTELKESAKMLTNKRLEGKSLLEQSVMNILKELSMSSSKFVIDITQIPFSDKGCDRVTFLLCANKGEKISPIKDTSSGGELSRIMLALKLALREVDEVATLLFDEVDSGVGGAVSLKVAEFLKSISKTHQVLTITHSAQIAAKADDHLLVEKIESNGRTISYLHKLLFDERVKEIARLLSGEQSDISIMHAKELLEV